VRMIKEKTCYIAVNPAKEEKDSLGRTEEFRLPDGNTVQVRYSVLALQSHVRHFHSLVPSDSALQRSSSTLR
jgi:hypothetical protein